jgi:hypothetical protein
MNTKNTAIKSNAITLAICPSVVVVVEAQFCMRAIKLNRQNIIAHEPIMNLALFIWLSFFGKLWERSGGLSQPAGLDKRVIYSRLLKGSNTWKRTLIVHLFLRE